jgi:hypothetical protein
MFLLKKTKEEKLVDQKSKKKFFRKMNKKEIKNQKAFSFSFFF